MTINVTGWGAFWIFLAIYVACEMRLYENGLESILTHSLIRKKKEKKEHEDVDVKVTVKETPSAPSIPRKPGRPKKQPKMDKTEVIVNVHE